MSWMLTGYTTEYLYTKYCVFERLTRGRKRLGLVSTCVIVWEDSF